MAQPDQEPSEGIKRAMTISESLFCQKTISEHLAGYRIPPRVSLYVCSRLENKKDIPDYAFEESVFLTGSCGSGKTVDAICNLYFHLKEWNCSRDPGKWNRTKEAIFTTSEELLEELKSSYSHRDFVFCPYEKGQVPKSQAVVNKYKNIDLLVIDDFGTEKTTEWAFQTLYLILSYRYGWEKFTVFTSNFSLEEIARKLGDSRLTSRIDDWCRIIDFGNTNHRNKR